VSHGAISRLDRGIGPLNIAAAGKLLAFFGRKAKKAFPEGADSYDCVVPVTDDASLIRNLRLRMGLQQAALANILGVSKVTIYRWERNKTRPSIVY